MIVAIISVCALVLAVVAIGAAALLTSRAALQQQLLEALGHRCSSTENLQRLTVPAALKAEVDDLRGALDTIRASNRKEFGSLWGRLGGRSSGTTFDGATGAPVARDEELEELVRFQNAKPAQ